MIPKVIDSLKKGIECYVSTELVVDPKFFKHIIGKNGSNSKLTLCGCVTSWVNCKLIFFFF